MEAKNDRKTIFSSQKNQKKTNLFIIVSSSSLTVHGVLLKVRVKAQK